MILTGIVELVNTAGGEAFVSRGVSRTIIGLVGDVEQFGALNLRSYPGVSDVVRISVPYKLVSREHHPNRSVITVGGVPIGPGHLTVIAGPCTVETAEQTLTSARMAQAAGASLLRGGAYKPRTSPYAFQGLGEAGLRILADVRAETGLPVVTEVIDPASVDLVSSYADMLQVGTRSMQNFTLLQAVGSADKPVLLKRGMNATIEEWLMAAEYIAQRGNLDIVLCERGIRTFETATRNTLDISAVPVAQRLSHLPVIVDPSHSGGRRDLVLPLSRAAIAVGADGIIVDVHPHPAAAMCDGDQALTGEDIRDLAAMVTTLPPTARAVAHARAAARWSRTARPRRLTRSRGPPKAYLRAGSNGALRLVWLCPGACACGQRSGDHRDDLAPDDLKRPQAPDARYRSDRHVEAHAGQPGQLIVDLGGALAPLPDVEHEVTGLLDLVVVAALSVAVRPQDIELAGQVRPGEQVARLRVAGDQSERLPLAAAADHDRRMRLGDRLRPVQRALKVVVLAVEGRLVAPPHLQADLQGLLKPLEALGDGRERDAQAARLLLVPGRTDA